MIPYAAEVEGSLFCFCKMAEQQWFDQTVTDKMDIRMPPAKLSKKYLKVNKANPSEARSNKAN